jgi:hypothetical protein
VVAAVVDIKTKAELFHLEVLVVEAMGAQVRLLLRQVERILAAVVAAVQRSRLAGLLVGLVWLFCVCQPQAILELQQVLQL